MGVLADHLLRPSERTVGDSSNAHPTHSSAAGCPTGGFFHSSPQDSAGEGTGGTVRANLTGFAIHWSARDGERSAWLIRENNVPAFHSVSFNLCQTFRCALRLTVGGRSIRRQLAAAKLPLTAVVSFFVSRSTSSMVVFPSPINRQPSSRRLLEAWDRHFADDG